MPPATTVRQTPPGIKLDNGHSTKIAFAADPDVSFWEKTVKPPGVDGGDGINTTTMFNVTYETMAARTLKKLTDVSVMAAYDPAVLTQIIALVNVETSITIRFPDGTTWDQFGYLKSFEPNELKEGEQPEASINIVITNADPTTGAEAAPVLTNVAGT